MDAWRNPLIAQCQATKAQAAELLERSVVLEHQVRDTLQQSSQNRVLRYGMLIGEADSLGQA